MRPTALALEMAYAGLCTPQPRLGTHAAMGVYIAVGGPFGAFARVN